jgi:hypothetical protein
VVPSASNRLTPGRKVSCPSSASWFAEIVIAGPDAVGTAARDASKAIAAVITVTSGDGRDIKIRPLDFLREDAILKLCRKQSVGPMAPPYRTD